MALINKSCENCSFILREKCEKAYSRSKEPINFIHCNTNRVKLLMDAVV